MDTCTVAEGLTVTQGGTAGVDDAPRPWQGREAGDEISSNPSIFAICSPVFSPLGLSFSETIMFLHQIFYQGLKARISSWPTLVLGECSMPPRHPSLPLAAGAVPQALC